MRPLVIGFYTENTPYQHEAESLKLSLETHEYEHDILAVPNLGSWQKNTQYKAQVIKGFLEKYPNRELLYLDVDAVMVHPPILLDNIDCDIAAVHFAKRNEFLSGTVYFAGSAACMKVVNRWIALNEQFPKTLPDGREAWDQRTLAMAIRDIKDCRYIELPQEYTWIVELTQKYYDKNSSPIIMHTRGAKRFKNKINGEEGYAT